MIGSDQVSNTVGGIIRVAVSAALGGLVTRGFLTGEQLEQIATLLIGLGGVIGMAVWSVITNRIRAVLSQAASSSEVSKIEADNDLANSIPSHKVVGDDLT